LVNVDLKFYRDGATGAMAEASTDSLGLYTIELPEGHYIVEGSKSNYINMTRNLAVSGTIQLGQGADVDLSAVLAEGEYRVVLRWGNHSRDLDSYTYFDTDIRKKSWWDNVGVPQVGPISGLSIVLDRDEASSFGPETTTITGVGKCTDACIVKFHVDNYEEPEGDRHLGDSDATIEILAGAGTLKKYSIPKSAGSDRGRTIFTLDASNSKVYDGDYTYGPYIDSDLVKVPEEKLCRTTWYCTWDAAVPPYASSLYGGSVAQELLHSDLTGWTGASPNQNVGACDASCGQGSIIHGHGGGFSIMTVTKTLSGSGELSVDMCNSHTLTGNSRNKLWVSINGVKMQETAEIAQREIVKVDFQDGDVLGISEEFGILCVYSVIQN